MLSILIADDDYLVRKGIQKTIDWQVHGFIFVGEAGSCSEAFRIFQETQPDIVITDIRMGRGNGLDLVDKIQELAPQTEFIIISGYKEFEYAKRALESGTVAYLLKPIQNDELLSAMLQAKEKLEKTHKMQQLESHLPYLKNSFLKDLLLNRNPNITKQQLEIAFHGMPLDSYHAALVALDRAQTFTPNEVSVTHGLLLSAIDYTAELYHFSLHRENLNAYSCILIIPCPQEWEETSALHFLSALQEQFSTLSEYTFSAGISRLHQGPSALAVAYREASSALKQKVLTGNGSIIDFNKLPKVSSSPVSISTQSIENIVRCIKKVDHYGAFQIIDTFFGDILKLKNVSTENIQTLVAEMLVMVLRSVFKNPSAIKTVFGHNLSPFWEVQKYETIEEIMQWTREIINKIFEDPNIYLECSYHPEIQQAVASIMQNYDKPLTVESIANNLLISPYYLMHLFKKETGKTFNAYLTEYRIKIAEELILSKKYKIYEISSMVGYKDPNYFSQIFKKFTGYTPKNYITDKGGTT